MAIDGDTKLIPHFDVGKRNMVTAYRFMDGLKARLNGNGRFQLTTDGFVPYIGAVEMAWGADAPDFAQLVALHFAYYNFVRIHRSLRVTPAMAAGVTERVWELRELLAI